VPGSFTESPIAAIAEEEFWLLLGVGGGLLLVALVALFVAQSAFRRARTALTEARLARQEARENRLSNELSARQSPDDGISGPGMTGHPPLVPRPEPEVPLPLGPLPEPVDPRLESGAIGVPVDFDEPAGVDEPALTERDSTKPPADLTDLSTRRALLERPRRDEPHPASAEPDARAQLMGDLRDPDPLVRIGALEGLAGDPAAQPALIAALGDDFPHVRREAVRALRALEGIEVVRAIIDVIDHDPAAEVREEALEVLVHSIRRHGAVHRGPSAD
jgi:HEAT repeats